MVAGSHIPRGYLIVMSLLAALASHLKADAGVSAITTRIYTDIPTARVATIPYIVIVQTGESSEEHQLAGDQLAEKRFQINIYEGSQGKAETGTGEIRSALHGVRNTLIGTTPNQETVVSSSMVNRLHTFLPDEAGGQGEWMGVTEFEIWHRQAL